MVRKVNDIVNALPDQFGVGEVDEPGDIVGDELDGPFPVDDEQESVQGLEYERTKNLVSEDISGAGDLSLLDLAGAAAAAITTTTTTTTTAARRMIGITNVPRSPST